METNLLRGLILLAATMWIVGCASAAAGPIGSPAPKNSPEPTRLPTATPRPSLQAGSTRHDPHDIEQVWVPAGSFQMGTTSTALEKLKALKPPKWIAGALSSEQPPHTVTLSQGYWIDKYEVTNAAFKAFVDDDGYQTQRYWSESGWRWLQKQALDRLPRSCTGSGPDYPRACLTWYEAEAYARWRGGRLPTEAEWEYAARGPQSQIYPWGNDFDPTRCNVVDSQGSQPVGSYPTGVSWVGAHDMAGNVMEWVADWLDVNYYRDAPALDPTGPDAGQIKVEKGGWWSSNLFAARSAYRHFEDPPDYGDPHIGFRIVSNQD